MRSRRALTRATCVAVATGVALGSAALAGCGDGRPPFCDRLDDVRSLDDLGAALEQGDLTAAGDEASALQELATGAPREIRPRFEAVAEGVADIVSLLEAEQDPAAVEPAEIERRRKELNDRLGELSDDSSAVAAWVEDNCGFSLS